MTRMIQLTSLLICVLIGAPGRSWCNPQQTKSANPLALMEVNLRIRRVGLDARYSTVLRKFGKPRRLVKERVLDDTCAPPHTTLRLNYDGLTVRLDGDIRGRNFRVVSFEVTSAKWLVSPGVRIGMAENEARTRLGEPSDVTDESGLRVVRYVTPGNDGVVALSFRKGTLSTIYWGFTLC
jgi:hypothetical protein